MERKKWSNKDALVTAFDEYKDELFWAIIGRTNYLNRAKDKPMAEIKEADNPHTTDREGHMFQTANEALLIAKGLGLNETVAYIGMLLHDAGQPFGAHDGEKTLDIISQILNTGFYHHTAKGVDVVLREDIITKFIDAVPDAKVSKELRDRLKNDVWYFLEMPVGHDGESTSNDNKKYAKSRKKYGSIKEAVLDKVAKANRTNKYKCAVETLEAQISKPADILAYMRSDVLAGFYSKILANLSDDYLELVAKLLTESKEETLQIEENIKQADFKGRKEIIKRARQERIKKAKDIIESIKISKLQEGMDEISESEQEIHKEVTKFIEELKQNGIDVSAIKEEELDKVREIRERIKSKYERRKLAQGENPDIVSSQVDKIDDYTKKIEQTRKRVVEELMTRMQVALRNDYIETTLSNWAIIEANEELSDEERYELKKQGMTFSDKVNEIIYGKNGIKDLNYREYVQYAKKEFQTGSLPKGVLKLVLEASKALKATGVIRNKFYDPEVLRNINNEELISLMHQSHIDTESSQKYRKKIGIIKSKKSGIKGIKDVKERRFTSKRTKQKIARNNLYKSIYRYAREYPESFARTCEDVYEAIPYTVRNMVEKAVRSDYEENEYLSKEEKAIVYGIRKDLAKRFGEYDGVAITKENLESYIQEQIDRERENIEDKVAIQICIDYIAGRSNSGIRDLLDKTGILPKRKIEKENKPNKKGNRVVQKLSADLRSEDGETITETESDFSRRMQNHKVPPIMVIDDEGMEK